MCRAGVLLMGVAPRAAGGGKATRLVYMCSYLSQFYRTTLYNDAKYVEALTSEIGCKVKKQGKVIILKGAYEQNSNKQSAIYLNNAVIADASSFTRVVGPIDVSPGDVIKVTFSAAVSLTLVVAFVD